MKNLKKLLLLLMMTSLFLFSCNKSSGGDYVVDQSEIKSTEEDMDKGIVGIPTSGVKYTLNPDIWGKPFTNPHVFTELLENVDHSGDIYGGVKTSFATTEDYENYGKILADKSLNDEQKKAEFDKIIAGYKQMWAINVIADDKMPKDDEGLKALTTYDNNEKLASVDGYNFVWSYMNKAEGYNEEDQKAYDKLYEDLDNVKKSIKVAKPTNASGAPAASASNKFDFETEDIYGNKFSAKDYLAEHEYTILNVWGTFCGPCKAEMPDLAKVYEEYKDKIGFLGVVSDVAPNKEDMSEAYKQNQNDVIALAKRIVESKGCTYPNLVPTQEMNDNFLSSVTGYPTTFVLDKEGNVVGTPIIGAQSYEGFKELCEQYISKEAK